MDVRERKLEDRGLIAADIYLQTAPDFMPYAANHPERRRRRKARDWFERSLAVARECGSRIDEEMVISSLGTVLSMLGRYEEACELSERSAAICREIGDERGEAYAEGGLGETFRLMGRYGEAVISPTPRA